MHGEDTDSQRHAGTTQTNKSKTLSLVLTQVGERLLTDSSRREECVHAPAEQKVHLQD